jgi:signal transduction histidine kinase
MTYNALLLAALLVVLAVCVVFAWRLVACQRDRAEITDRLKTSTTAEKSAVRQLRMASHSLRAIGMTLQGHTEHLEAGGNVDIPGVANAVTGVFDLADYMHEWAEHAESTHVLNEEVLSLGSALDEAISTVKRAIQPGQRTWHIDPDVLAMRLRADRRALRHVLTRALSASVRSSGHEDTIDVRIEGAELEGAKKAVALVIEDQPSSPGRSNPILDGALPDLRLTLARTLMEAHGGKLDIEQGDALSVHIVFPIERVVKSSDDTRESPKVGVVGRKNDDRMQGASVT